MITGEQIRDARKRAGLSQAELANRVGVVPRTVGGWERGESAPGIAEQRLLEVLRDHLARAGEPPLREVSDAELVAEIARRFARVPGQVREDAVLAGRTTARAPSGQQSEEQRAAELGLEVLRPAQEQARRRDEADADENSDEGVTGA